MNKNDKSSEVVRDDNILANEANRTMNARYQRVVSLPGSTSQQPSAFQLIYKKNDYHPIKGAGCSLKRNWKKATGR